MRPGLAAAAERVGLAADCLFGLPAPYPGPYMDTWLGLVRARALISASRVGVFDALPGTTSELASRTACDAERLEVLRALRYVRLRRSTWRVTRRTRASFGAGARMPLDATVGSLADANWDVLKGLDDVLRGGPPPGLHDGSPDEAVWTGYQAAMVELNGLVAGPVLDGLGEPRRLLDIGGGPGSFAIAACRRWPQLDVVIADLPQAAVLGYQRVTAAGLEDRIRYVAGDARTGELGSGCDTVTLLQLLHNVDRQTCVELLQVAAGAAGSDGRVTVLEIEGSRTQIGALASVAFTAWMGSRTWTAAQLTEMAGEAGLVDVRCTRPARLAGSVLLHGRPRLIA